MLISVHALPITEFARLNGLSAAVPQFMPISLRIGPFTTIMRPQEVVELGIDGSCEAASARITGKCSGRAPAITAIAATFSTVYSIFS